MQSFLNWASLQNIRLHHDVTVQQSSLGGYGLINHAHLPEDTVILRTPKAAVFDLSSCMAHKTHLEQSGPPRIASIINSFLACSENVSETLILRNYIWAYAALSQIMDISFQPYLDILNTTETLHPDPTSWSADTFLQQQLTRHEAVKRDYDRAVENDIDLCQLLPYDMALQLHKAVVSRALEIPATDNVAHVNNIAKTDKSTNPQNMSGDFFTNISLVPMLDFANHSASNVAVFDVDLASDDVILRLTRSVDANSEITISYDPCPSVNHFFTTYGFVPAHTARFTWHIDNLDEILSEIMCRSQDFSRIAKWLHVIPAVTMTFANDKLLLELHPRLPILLIEGLEYFPKWKSEIADLKEEYQTEDISQIIAQLERHELSSPVVPSGETAFGVLYNDTYVSIPHVIEQTGNSEEKDPTIVTRTAQLLRRAAEVSLQRLDIKTEESNGIMQYKCAKKGFLEKLVALSEQELVSFVEKAVEVM